MATTQKESFMFIKGEDDKLLDSFIWNEMDNQIQESDIADTAGVAHAYIQDHEIEYRKNYEYPNPDITPESRNQLEAKREAPPLPESDTLRLAKSRLQLQLILTSLPKTEEFKNDLKILQSYINMIQVEDINLTNVKVDNEIPEELKCILSPAAQTAIASYYNPRLDPKPFASRLVTVPSVVAAAAAGGAKARRRRAVK